MLKYSFQLQIMRGIAILMILLHHSISHLPQSFGVIKLTLALNHVHVVVFFVISGILFEFKRKSIYSKGIKSFFYQKIKRLLLPYLFWFVSLSIEIKILCKISPVEKIINGLGYQEWSFLEIIWNTLTMQNYYTMHLWFVYVLFIIYIINVLLKDKFSDWKIFIVLFLLFNIILTFFNPPLLLERFLKHSLNFFAGRMIIRYYSLDILRNNYITMSSVIILGCLSAIEYFSITSFTYTYIGNMIWGLVGTQFIFAVACILKERLYFISDILKIIGDYSYPIYLIHNPYIISAVYILFKLFTSFDSFILSYGYVLLSILLSILIPVIFNKIISRYHVLSEIMFGA